MLSELGALGFRIGALGHELLGSEVTGAGSSCRYGAHDEKMEGHDGTWAFRQGWGFASRQAGRLVDGWSDASLDEEPCDDFAF